MKKIKYLLLLVCITGCFAACNKSNTDTTLSVAAQLTIDTTAIRKYIVKNNIPALKDKSGIFYQIILPGSGTKVWSTSTVITGSYSGKLLNASTTFGSGTIESQFLSSFIQGWQIGIPYIQNGGQIRLFIPSEYGYGNVANGAIPANSILDFTISLTDVQ